MKRGDSEDCLNKLHRWARSAAISADTRDGHEMLRLLLQPPRSLCASTGHYPHLPSWEPVQPATVRVSRSRDKFPRRTHSMPQEVAMSCQPLLPQARPAFYALPLPRGVSQSPLISCYFNPILSEGRTDASGNLHAEVEPNPKLNPRSCANKEEKGKFLPVSLRSSGLNLHNQLNVACITGIPEQTTNHPKIEAKDFV